MADSINVLKEWTGKARATVVFDSTVDEFTDNGIFNKVKGKPNIALVGFTTDGDVFGGFYSVAVDRQDRWFFDPNIFAFSFESHGRCMTPQRFFVKERRRKKAFVRFEILNSNGFVRLAVFGVGGFTLGNESSKSCCWDMSNAFEGIEDTTLTGKDFHSSSHFIRLVVIQFE